VVIALALALAACAGCGGSAPEKNMVQPAQAAKDFMAELQLPDAGASCSQDNEKPEVLAACTVSLDRGSDFPPLLFSIECAPRGGTMVGCRATPEVLKLLMDAKIVLGKGRRPAPSAPAPGAGSSAP
jgi:hypothetical protein